ncbi:MAG: hypothetical protein JSW11_08885 [Candidatus Heimdallarchaeota archaeon]|nr:MAG: hypothetical protein JSW11_08885 [Candidatus Heimdallarchaeota archaeon]
MTQQAKVFDYTGDTEQVDSIRQKIKEIELQVLESQRSSDQSRKRKL